MWWILRLHFKIFYTDQWDKIISRKMWRHFFPHSFFVNSNICYILWLGCLHVCNSIWSWQYPNQSQRWLTALKPMESWEIPACTAWSHETCVWLLTHTKIHVKHLFLLTNSAFLTLPLQTKANTSGGTRLCIIPKMLTQKMCTHIQVQNWQEPPIFGPLSPDHNTGHKTDHYPFETQSTTRTLNPWMFTYVSLVLKISHKTSCLYLLISFLSSPNTVNHKHHNNRFHTRNSILKQKETRGHVSSSGHRPVWLQHISHHGSVRLSLNGPHLLGIKNRQIRTKCHLR